VHLHMNLRTCYRDRATSGVDAGTSVWSAATVRDVVFCLHSCRLSVCSRDSVGARSFHRPLSLGRSDHRVDSAPELCREDAIFDLRLHSLHIIHDNEIHLAKLQIVV